MKRKLLITVALLGASLLASTAFADPVIVQGTGTFTDTGPSGNGLNFTAPDSPFNLNLYLNQPDVELGFIQITPTVSADAANNVSDTVMESFTFTVPDALTPTTITGTGQIDGNSNNFKLTWDSVPTVTFSDGTQLTISLEDGNFNTIPAKVDATFELTKDPTTSPVPEPASLALLGTGMLGLGLFRHRAKRPTA